LPPSLVKGRGSADKRGAKPLSKDSFPLSLGGEKFGGELKRGEALLTK
jgi:hypothetical protein